MERLDDLSHGVHNDIELTISKTGLAAHQLLMKLSRNCVHGPWGEGVRFRETSGAVQEYCALIGDGNTCPLFVSLAPSMLEDKGEEHRDCEEGIIQELFDDFQGSFVFTNLGSKVAAPRFCSSVHACREQDSTWTIMQLGFLITCLMSGLYSQEKIQEVFHTKKLPVPANETEQTVAESKPTKETVACEVAKYKKYTKNQLEIATLMYNNPENKYRQRLLMVCSDPIVDWHSKQNRTLRSASEAITWEIEEMTGAVWEPLKATVSVMSDASKLQFVGLQLDFSAGAMVGLTADDPRVVWNGKQAQLMGSFITRLLSQRIRRLLPILRGWPRRCVLGLDQRHADDEAAEARLGELPSRQGQYGDKFSKTMVNRSLFESAHVSSYISAFEESDFLLSPSVLEMLRKRHARVIGTQLAEDGFDVQRKAEAKGTSPINGGRPLMVRTHRSAGPFKAPPLRRGGLATAAEPQCRLAEDHVPAPLV